MLEISELKPGDVIYESQYGVDIATLVLTKPISDEEGWSFLGVSENDVITFFNLTIATHIVYDYIVRPNMEIQQAVNIWQI